MRATSASLAGAALLLALTGCSNAAPTPTHPDLWVAAESSGFSGLAIVAGNLTRNADGCFGLSISFGQPEAPEFITTQFPKGTEVLEDEAGVRLPNGEVVLLGEFIDGGGGYSSGDSPEGYENFPASCPAEDVAFLSLYE
ncbi:hypothetical protein [Pseudoclavibacter sp. RFBB5]|uniref:hypothetical protein n=1 Tax=Pseudoclavibacter sp. RFBB5 TaxID=2080574 RepID=UPI000CE7A4A2|nr:hypothetical protein [Pseudoclavibacter sp. RFBB5]